MEITPISCHLTILPFNTGIFFSTTYSPTGGSHGVIDLIVFRQPMVMSQPGHAVYTHFTFSIIHIKKGRKRVLFLRRRGYNI